MVVNFSAGPGVLFPQVLQKVQEELISFGASSDSSGMGISILEMSHRSSTFGGVLQRLEADMRYLLTIPDNYRVLFMQGGATAQFAAVVYNLAPNDTPIDYVVTGTWSKKAHQEAQLLKSGGVNVINQTAKNNEDAKIISIPASRDGTSRKFVYYCDNETVDGILFPMAEMPDYQGDMLGNVSMICDMSSSFLSRPIDVSRYGLIFAGAQKNVGPAGVTVVIVRDDLLVGPSPGPVPSILDYRLMAQNASMYNTPPVFSMYVVGLTCKHIREAFAHGNFDSPLANLSQLNDAKAALLYSTIDSSNGFYVNPIHPKFRSKMNIVFRIVWQDKNQDLESRFIKDAAALDLIELKGHRSVGGIRASLYNAMTLENVKALCQFMLQFQSCHKK